jgi:ribosomal protein L7/L12
MGQCKDCRFWQTGKRQGFMAPCDLHFLPHGVEVGDDGQCWEDDTMNVWMPDLGACSGFEKRVKHPHTMRMWLLRRTPLKSISAIKLVRAEAGLSTIEAKAVVEKAMAAGNRGHKVTLGLKDFDGFRKQMEGFGFAVEPTLP